MSEVIPKTEIVIIAAAVIILVRLWRKGSDAREQGNRERYQEWIQTRRTQ